MPIPTRADRVPPQIPSSSIPSTCQSKYGFSFAHYCDCRKTKAFFKTMKRQVTQRFQRDVNSDGASSYLGSEASTSLADMYVKVRAKGKKRKLFGRLILVQQLQHFDPVSPTSPIDLPPLRSSSSALPVSVSQGIPAIRESNSMNFPQQSPATNNTNGPGSKTDQALLQDHQQTHGGAIWVLRFNREGQYLASGGQDGIVRVWALASEPGSVNGNSSDEKIDKSEEQLEAASPRLPPIFKSKPHRIYAGHTADILDLSWSKNDFLLSSSMDKTVRLWHVSRKECLCIFQHADFVTSVAFHPKDDRFFLSGCLDCRLRLWNIPEKKVNFWNETPDSNLITAVGFSWDGKIAIAGSYLGNCYFYETDGLKYNTQVHVKSTRGKNSRGEKITGIEAMPNQTPGDEKVCLFGVGETHYGCRF